MCLALSWRLWGDGVVAFGDELVGAPIEALHDGKLVGPGIVVAAYGVRSCNIAIFPS